MTLEKALWQQSVTYPARLDRRLIQALLAEGVMDSTALRVTERGAGVNYSVDVAAGDCVITGDAVTDQNNYYCRSTAVENKVPSSVPGADSRIDRVVAQIRDNTHDGGGNNDWIITIIAGTVAASPVAPATPASAISLATIGPITPSTTTITNSMITDTRTVSLTRLADNNVTAAKLAADAVTTAKILDANVTTAKIANANVTLAKIASAAYAQAATGDTLAYRDSSGRTQVATPVSSTDAANKGYADGLLVDSWDSVSLGGGWSGTFIFRGLNNMVFLIGNLDTSSGSTSIGTLPVGYRPSSTIRIPDNVTGGGGSVSFITVNTDGTVVAGVSGTGLTHTFSGVIPL